MRKQKILLALLAISLLALMCACGKEANNPSSEPTQSAEATVQPTEATDPTSAPEVTEAPTTAPTGEPSVEPTAEPTQEAVTTPEATKAPTATPTKAATATPVPTSIPVSTATVAATATPAPTATSAPIATATPVPTATATPAPTATPLPTATPAPTTTPLPTATPVPTATPMPSGMRKLKNAIIEKGIKTDNGDYTYIKEDDTHVFYISYFVNDDYLLFGMAEPDRFGVFKSSMQLKENAKIATVHSDYIITDTSIINSGLYFEGTGFINMETHQYSTKVPFSLVGYNGGFCQDICYDAAQTIFKRGFLEWQDMVKELGTSYKQLGFEWFYD